jgi:hypothetical protein
MLLLQTVLQQTGQVAPTGTLLRPGTLDPSGRLFARHGASVRGGPLPRGAEYQRQRAADVFDWRQPVVNVHGLAVLRLLGHKASDAKRQMMMCLGLGVVIALHKIQ